MCLRNLTPVLILAFVSIALGDSVYPAPETVVTQNVPPISQWLADRFEAYMDTQPIQFQGWYAGRRQMLTLRYDVFLLRGPRAEPLQMTDLDLPVSGAFPKPGPGGFVYSLDNDGREWHQFYFLDPSKGRPIPITDGGSNYRYPEWSRSGRFLALSASPFQKIRDRLCVIDLANVGQPRWLAGLPPASAIAAWSPDDRHVAITSNVIEEKNNVRLVEVATGQDEVIGTYGATVIDPSAVRSAPLRWSADGKRLYWVSLRDSDFLRIVRYDRETRQEKPLGTEIPWDVEEFDLADDNRTLVLVANEDGASTFHVLDAETGEERPAPKVPMGRVMHLAFRPGSTEFAFTLDACDSRQRIHSYDLATRRADRWGAPEQAGRALGATDPPQIVRYPSFDGQMIPAFVTRPGPPFKSPFPVLIDFHGGPCSQSRPGHLRNLSLLINELGIALIRPNIRGSTGYGSKYECLDDGTGREGSLKDIGALLDWIAQQPDLDKDRVAVSGGSYGGFLSLSALAHYGDRLRAGVADCAASDLLTTLSVRSPEDRKLLVSEYGDLDDPKVVEGLRAISPIANASKIHLPILVVHGANDPRVPVADSARFVAEVRKNKVPVWCILAKNEGHTATDYENWKYRTLALFLFLKRYLLGPKPETSPAIAQGRPAG